LRHVLGGGETDQRRRIVAYVVGDREELKGGERAEDHIDLVALDQFLRLGLGAGRIAASVGGDQFDLAVGRHVFLLAEKGEDPLLHLVAALRERAGLHREQADFEGGRLRPNERRLQHGQAAGRGQALQYGSALDRHQVLPWQSHYGLFALVPFIF